jgi:hypothetical protein
MANISNVINVALIPEGQLAGRDNMNTCAIMTSEGGTGSFLNSFNRYATYSSIQGVAGDWGTDTDAYAHATTFFSQTPNPVNANGSLTIAYWRAAQETTAASAGYLTGAQTSEATTVAALQAISDGSFDIDVDAGTQNITNLDFRTVASFADIIVVIDAVLTGATTTVDDQKIIITSDTTGASSAVSFASVGASGTFVGTILALSDGSGAAETAGLASQVLAIETKVQALDILKTAINFKGVVYIDNPTDSESALLAAWSQANSTLSYDVFNAAANLERDITNVVWTTKLAGQTNYRMLYSASNQRKLATGYMARAHVVNFNGDNTALTMQVKEIKGVIAEDYTQTEIDKAKAVGLDIYTTIKDVPVVLTSPANDFMDNRYNLIGYIDAVQTDTFNLLKQTGTKVAQTTQGVDKIEDSIEKTTQGFVSAGVFAPGTWTSPDFFGVLETLERSIEANGFYVLAGQLSDQPQVDRQNRISPVVQVAAKNAGAIHEADIIINFNI